MQLIYVFYLFKCLAYMNKIYQALATQAILKLNSFLVLDIQRDLLTKSEIQNICNVIL